jgi:hypothetical protein
MSEEEEILEKLLIIPLETFIIPSAFQHTEDQDTHT